MRKILTAALAAVTLGGAVAATAVPAQAQPYHGWHHGHRYYGHHHGGVAGPALAAGIAGLAVGAALASPNYGYARPAYAYPAYGYGYYGYAPAYCEGGRWVWDPYIHRRVYVRSTYPC
jgi:hypothetical protein